MFNQQQIIQQDSIVKQIVQKDSLRDTVKKNIAVKITPVKLSNQQIVQPEELVNLDSLPKQDTVKAEPPVVSLFTGHELKPKNSKPIEKTYEYSGWITVLLIGSLMVIAYLRAAYPKRFIEFFRAVWDMRFAQQLVREEKVLSQRVSVFLIVIFFFSGTTFLYFVYNFFGLHLFTGEDFLIFLKIGLSIFSLFIIRIFFIELAGFVFDAPNEFSFYSFHVFLFNKILGLALIPILAGLVYATRVPEPAFIYTGIFLFMISYFARLIRGLNIGMSKQGYNKFYLFFYFCTLEILPAVVLSKIIMNHAV